MARDDVALAVLAAGAGTRMRSRLPKPLHPVAGFPMLWHVLRAAGAAHPVARVVVLSPALATDPVWRSAGFDVIVATQDAPDGTAGAALAALPALPDARWLLLLFADHPLLTAAAVERLITSARERDALVTLLTCCLPAAAAYGRIDRDGQGRPRRVVERKDDDPAARTGPAEINSGMMVVDLAFARSALPRITPSETTGELYLPELVRLAVEQGGREGAWPVATVEGDWDELRGVNDRVELADADRVLRDRIRRRHMLAGVSMIQAESIVIDEDVEIGEDTMIHPFTVIRRGSRIGSGCEIGPHAILDRAVIGDGVSVRASTVTESVMEQASDAGPYAHLRGGTRVGPHAHVGNFAELKLAHVGEDARIGHVSYVGDATVGARTNIGAGTITCNFDGVDKHRTEIGADAFIGSDSMLVAPLSVGDGARTGAGSVVTKDVPAGATVVGVPARLIRRTRHAEGAG